MNKFHEMAQPIQMQYAALSGSINKSRKSQTLFYVGIVAFMVLSTTLMFEKPAGPLPDQADISMFNENQYQPSQESTFNGSVQLAGDDCAFLRNYLSRSCGPGKAPCTFVDKGNSCSYSGKIHTNKAGRVYLPAMCTGSRGTPYSGCSDFPVDPVVISK